MAIDREGDAQIPDILRGDINRAGTGHALGEMWERAVCMITS